MILVTFHKTGKVSVKRYKDFKDYLKKQKKRTVAKLKKGDQV